MIAVDVVFVVFLVIAAVVGVDAVALARWVWAAARECVVEVRYQLAWRRFERGARR